MVASLLPRLLSCAAAHCLKLYRDCCGRVLAIVKVLCFELECPSLQEERIVGQYALGLVHQILIVVELDDEVSEDIGGYDEVIGHWLPVTVLGGWQVVVVVLQLRLDVMPVRNRKLLKSAFRQDLEHG